MWLAPDAKRAFPRCSHVRRVFPSGPEGPRWPEPRKAEDRAFRSTRLGLDDHLDELVISSTQPK